VGERARRTRAVLALAVGLIALVGPPSAGGATTVGQTFVPDGLYSGGFTAIQSSYPGQLYTVPAAGVITSWSFQAAATQVPVGIKFKVARPGGGDNFTIIGGSGSRNPTAGALNTYTDVAIAVQPGDVLGLYTGDSGGLSRRGDPGCALLCTAREVPFDAPPGNATAFGDPILNYALDISASVEPDCDSDGLGDETQDPQLPAGGPCPIRGRSVTLDASKNKVKKRKKVTLSGQLTEFLRQGECQATQTVELQRKKPSQTIFATIEQVQTFASGSFSAKVKVKKTYEYRAQVAETPTCGTAVSNTEKVKVKKPK
jgi:hypothetical protein